MAAGEIGGMQGGLYWFKAPADPTQGGAAWQRFDIDTTITNCYIKVYSMDVNNDGWKDIIVSGTYGAVLFINPGEPGNPSAVWEKKPFPADTGVGMYLDDIDNDGQTEVINTLHLVNGNVSWFKVLFETGEIVFNRAMIVTGLNSPFDVCSLRVNDDLNHDVIVPAVNKSDPNDPGRLYWYESPADITGTWIQHVISNNIGASDVYPGDIDKDGRNDFIVSVLFENRISWFKNGLLNGEIVWSEHALDDNILIPGDITLADIDGDGDLDVETSAVYGTEVVWYENKLNETPTTTIPPTTTTTIGPTVIELSSFSVSPKSGAIILRWSTESEIDNAGFNLYRANSENGDYLKINTSLISAKGSSTQGASYEFTDTEVQNRKTYYYKLEDIDLNGKSTMHGPVSATPRLIYGMKK